MLKVTRVMFMVWLLAVMVERCRANGPPAQGSNKSDDKYGPMKVSDLPIVHDTAVELGQPNSMDNFIRHVDQQIAMGRTAPKNDAREKARHQPKRQFAPQDLLRVQPSQYAPGHPQSPQNRQMQEQRQEQQQKQFQGPQKGKAILRPDGWIESRPGDVIDIPLQTASPNIPKEIIDYFEKSRKADLKLVSRIEAAENAEGRRAMEEGRKKYEAEFRKQNKASGPSVGSRSSDSSGYQGDKGGMNQKMTNDFDNSLEEWARMARQKLKEEQEKKANQNNNKTTPKTTPKTTQKTTPKTTPKPAPKKGK